jgi:hypothetical protein
MADLTHRRVLSEGQNKAHFFRWQWLWPKLPADFGIESDLYPAHRMQAMDLQLTNKREVVYFICQTEEERRPMW